MATVQIVSGDFFIIDLEVKGAGTDIDPYLPIMTIIDDSPTTGTHQQTDAGGTDQHFLSNGAGTDLSPIFPRLGLE